MNDETVVPTVVEPPPTPVKEKKPRNSKGEGGVYFHEKSGLYQARLGGFKTGKKSREAYGHTPKEARAKLRELQTALKNDAIEPSKDKLEKFVAWWLDHKIPDVEKSTLQAYRAMAKAYIYTDPIARMPVGRIKPMDVESFTSRLRKSFEGKKHSGGRTVRGVHIQLGMIFRKAAAMGLISSSPMSDGKVAVPKHTAAARLIWTAEQVRTFLDAAARHDMNAFFMLALTTGLRHGELLGLEEPDINWEKEGLYCSKSLSEVSGEALTLKPPKSKAGLRHLPLEEGVLMAIAARLKVNKRLGFEGGLLFPNRTGGYAGKNVTYRAYRKILKDLNLPYITIHDLRHTYCSHLAALGTDLKVIQELAGHSDFRLTANLYRHVLPSEREAVRARLPMLYGRNTPAPVFAPPPAATVTNTAAAPYVPENLAEMC